MAARKASAAKTVTNDRNKALEVALSQIDKQFGKGSVMRLGDDNRPPVQVIPTGSLALDVALGIGGLPRGRVIEVYGPESSGKTTVALHAVANAQKAGGNAAFIDAEHALDPVYARALGVDTDSLLVSQPDTGEQALEIADMLIRSGGIDIIVIDSVAALVPKAEIEGEMGDSHVGLQARLMSQALRKITGALSATGTTAIFINQLREKIGVFFGSPETTTGGKALKFYASVRIDVRRIETLKEAGSPVGNRTRAKVVKNKMAPPFKQAEFDIVYGKGISREGSIIDMGVEAGIVRKSGSWFTYGDDQLGQGKENVRQFLVDNPELANEIEQKILIALGIAEEPEPEKGAKKAPAVDPDEDAGFCAVVRYLDPEDHPELGEERVRRTSPGERLARARERNAALTGTAAIEAAREVALRKLDARACSRAELTGAIEGRGFSAELALQVVDRLEAVGLVDDQAYADALVRSRFAGTGASGRALRELLVRKGLDAPVIEHALSQIDRDDEAERAAQLVARKRRSLAGVPRDTAYRRLCSMLARKGYSPAVASNAVREALDEWHAGSADDGERWSWEVS